MAERLSSRLGLQEWFPGQFHGTGPPGEWLFFLQSGSLAIRKQSLKLLTPRGQGLTYDAQIMKLLTQEIKEKLSSPESERCCCHLNSWSQENSAELWPGIRKLCHRICGPRALPHCKNCTDKVYVMRFDTHEASDWSLAAATRNPNASTLYLPAENGKNC